MKCYCTKKGFKSYPLMLKSYWQLLHLFYVLCLFYRLVPVSCTLMLHCSSTTTRYLLLWRSIVLKAGYFKGFWWKNEDFLLLSLTWIFTIVFCSLLFHFPWIFCLVQFICVNICKREGQRNGWQTSSVMSNIWSIWRGEKHLPGTAVVQTKTEATDWLWEMACLANPGFALLTDLFWDIFILIGFPICVQLGSSLSSFSWKCKQDS